MQTIRLQDGFYKWLMSHGNKALGNEFGCFLLVYEGKLELKEMKRMRKNL
jgi:hypothetical protein